MKINLKKTILALLVIIMIFGVYKAFELIKQSKTSKQQPNGVQDLIMGTPIFTSSDKKITFPYPTVVSGLTTEQTLTFNNFAENFAEKVYDSQIGEMPNTWDGSVTVERADSKIISVDMQAILDFGAAHPDTSSYTINYSVKDSKEITFQDLFNEKPGYLNTLSTLVRTRVNEGFKMGGVDPSAIESMIEDGTKPDSKNFQKFVIGNFYITFIYDPYEVAPYAYGTRQAMISFDELKEILKADLTK